MIEIIAVVLILVIVRGFFYFTGKVVEEEEIETKLTERVIGGVTEIIYWQKDERYFYEVELLRMALENTVDVYGAGAQRSDPKRGNREDYPSFFGPQGDVRYVYNYVRYVRIE